MQIVCECVQDRAEAEGIGDTRRYCTSSRSIVAAAAVKANKLENCIPGATVVVAVVGIIALRPRVEAGR